MKSPTKTTKVSKGSKRTDKITKVVTAAAVVGTFFVISYFVFVKDIRRSPTVVFPAQSGIANSEGVPFKDEERAAWIWQSPLTLKDEDWREYLEFAKKDNLTTLYLDITDYTDIFELADIAKRERDMVAFTDALRNKVRMASEYGIAVEGLAGQNHWGNSSHWYLPLEVVSYVQNYNSSSDPSERLAGIQFDIEPVQQPDFDTASSADRELILQEFLTLIDGISKRITAESPKMRIGFVIPFWLDGTSSMIGSVPYNGERKFVTEHAMDALAQPPLGYVALLVYRNYASGDNGSIEQARREFEYVEKEGLNLKIILAQEFSPIDEEIATYYGMDKNKVVSEISALRSAFESKSQFLGIAFHDLAYYRLMISIIDKIKNEHA